MGALRRGFCRREPEHRAARQGRDARAGDADGRLKASGTPIPLGRGTGPVAGGGQAPDRERTGPNLSQKRWTETWTPFSREEPGIVNLGNLASANDSRLIHGI